MILDSALAFLLWTLTWSGPLPLRDFGWASERVCLRSAESSLEAKPCRKIRKAAQQISYFRALQGPAQQSPGKGSDTEQQLKHVPLQAAEQKRRNMVGKRGTSW